MHTCAGQDVPVEAVSSGFTGAEGDEEALSWVEVKVPQKQPAGLLHMEVARGALLSHSKVSFLDTFPPHGGYREVFAVYADRLGIAAHNGSKLGKVIQRVGQGHVTLLLWPH